MSLVLYNRVDAPQGQSAWPFVVSEQGSGALYDAIAGCSGYPHGIGAPFPSATGAMNAPFGAAMSDLIAQDSARRRQRTVHDQHAAGRQAHDPGALRRNGQPSAQRLGRPSTSGQGSGKWKRTSASDCADSSSAGPPQTK
jgi:hypothetical protein